MVLPYRRDHSMTYGLGGVVTEEGKPVEEGFFFHVFNHSGKPDWGGAYSPEEEPEDRQETAVFAGFINNNEWGHFLTDWSSRLWYAVREDRESLVVFCRRGEGELHPNIVKALEYAGIPKERLLILPENGKAMRFPKLYVPEPALSPEGFTAEYRVPFEEIAENIRKQTEGSSRYDKIYMTRTGLRPLKDFGEEEIEAYYERNGFKVLRPETMSLEEQVRAYASCSEVASLEGTPAHNILFSRKGIRQTILEKSQAVNARQLLICQSCEADVCFVGTYPKVKFYDYYSDGPFLVGITRKFIRYAREREGFPEEPVSKPGVWIRNYGKYVTIRIGRRIGSVFRRIGRVMRFK